MKTNKQVREEVKSIVNPQCVEVVSITRNIQGSVDIELDHSIFSSSLQHMENKIRDIKGVVVNDIFYRE